MHIQYVFMPVSVPVRCLSACVCVSCSFIPPRVSFETSFDSKQPKLEPKLVSAQSETKCLLRLFRFYTETESFGVSIEPKQTEDQPKQFDREHILVFFHKILCCFGFFLFVSHQFVSNVSNCIPKQRVLM
jgi:hypothetical protein